MWSGVGGYGKLGDFSRMFFYAFAFGWKFSLFLHQMYRIPGVAGHVQFFFLCELFIIFVRESAF